MKKYLTIHLNLPSEFHDELNDIINNEIDVSRRKIKVELKSEDRVNIYNRVLQQLNQKVSTVCNSPWNHKGTINVRLADFKDGAITLPTEGAVDDISIARKGFKFTIVEPSDDAIHLTDFYDYMLELIVTWCRTATFYGVLSYAN